MSDKKPIDVIKTQLHYIVGDLDKISKHLTELRGDIQYVKEYIKQQKIHEENKKKEDAIQKQKIQTGWGLF